MKRAVFAGVMAVMAGAVSAVANVPAPPVPHLLHAAWYVDTPSPMGEFLDYPPNSGTGFLERNQIMPGDGVEIDFFVANESLTREGLLIRNESDVTVDITLSGCAVIDMNAHSHFETIAAIDQPPGADLHVVLPPRNYVAANLSDPNGKAKGYFPRLTRFSRRHAGGVQCDKITITHPPP